MTTRTFENPLYKFTISESQYTDGTQFTAEAKDYRHLVYNEESVIHLDQVQETQ